MTKIAAKLIDFTGDLLGTSKYKKTSRYLDRFLDDEQITRKTYNQNKDEILEDVKEMKGLSFRYQFAHFIDDRNDGSYERDLVEKAEKLRHKMLTQYASPKI